MTSEERIDRRLYVGAMIYLAVLAGGVLALMIFPGSTQHIPLIQFVGCGCMFFYIAIGTLYARTRELRRQVTKLEQKLADAAQPAVGEAPKAAYSKDDDGQRRLHISRLE